MQQILHSSLLTMAIILVTGDVTMIENMAVALPVFLLESHYSREDETEADRYAFESMIEAGIDPGHFGEIMQKLGEFDEREADETESSDLTVEREDVHKKEKSLLEYLSSHPATEERIRQANYYSALYKKRALDRAESGLSQKSFGH
jgi:predicted Zn-dependent protease